MKLKDWVLTLPWDEISNQADMYKVPRRLLGAIVMTESGGNEHAVRFEPGWKYFHQVRPFASNLGITEATETMLQATSWGLCQVMGAVCRELGFKEHLTKMTDQKLNLSYGCLKIKQLASRYNTESDIIAAYNAGSAIMTTGKMYRNQTYVDKVTGYLRELEALNV